MDAMILAAGLGTRLAPLTDDRPKALVEVGGAPILVHVARRLVAAGATRLVINVHPFPEQVEAVVEAHAGFGVDVVLSYERERPLETGGGLAAAAPLLTGTTPFFLHNGDIWSDMPLGAMHAAHVATGAEVTLAVMDRPTTRFLRFDDAGFLGWENRATGKHADARTPVGEITSIPFCCAHVIDPALPATLERGRAYSIIEVYMRRAAAGARILPFRIDGSTWVDIGRPAELEKARRLAQGDPS